MQVKTVAIMEVNPLFKPALKGAVKEVLKETGLIYRAVVKQMTTDEGHVVTGRYRKSIGNMASSDGIFKYGPNENYLDVGTNVFYSTILEDRYSMLARGVDSTATKAKERVGVVFSTYIDSNS